MMARTADDFRQEPAPARSVSPDVVPGMIRALAERAGWALWRWYQVHQTTSQLRVPDYLLKDIGLSRSMLISATVHRVREEEAIRRGAYG